MSRLYTGTRYQRCRVCNKQIRRTKHDAHILQHKLDRLMGEPKPFYSQAYTDYIKRQLTTLERSIRQHLSTQLFTEQV